MLAAAASPSLPVSAALPVAAAAADLGELEQQLVEGQGVGIQGSVLLGLNQGLQEGCIYWIHAL